MNRRETLYAIIEYFQQQQPAPETELNYKTEYELAVAVILSAQCTDKRVNIITPPLFQKFPDFSSMAKASVEEIFAFVKSCSYPNNKSKHLYALSLEITNNYSGKLPSDVETLTTLPGIGRKTAHVLVSVLHNEDVLAVDTHVFRVSHRIGIVNDKATTPLSVEKQIVENIIDKNILSTLHHWLILHGRYVCIARKPKCEECGIKHLCNYYKDIKK